MTASVTESRHALTVLRVEAILMDCLQHQIEGATSTAGEQFVRAVRDFVARDCKRLRPLFCYWGWRGAGGDGSEDDVLAVAAAIELFHAAALIHDDLIDDSDLRRGLPTLHRVLADLHRDAGWRGDSEQFGRNAALLAGDGCLVWSEELFHGRQLGPYATRARTLYARLRAETVHGEYLDMVGQARGGSVKDAMEIARFKTAGYTVRYPLQVGGLLAGAGKDVLAAYDGFGRLVGEAFQLRDDLVGCFGDPAVTGKSITDDACQGKPTALVAAARDLADPGRRARIDALYGRGPISDAEAAELRDLFEAVGARVAVEEMIAVSWSRALEYLRRSDICPDAVSELRELASSALARDR